jgi:hypothetical protein
MKKATATSHGRIGFTDSGQAGGGAGIDGVGLAVVIVERGLSAVLESPAIRRSFAMLSGRQRIPDSAETNTLKILHIYGGEFSRQHSGRSPWVASSSALILRNLARGTLTLPQFTTGRLQPVFGEGDASEELA